MDGGVSVGRSFGALEGRAGEAAVLGLQAGDAGRLPRAGAMPVHSREKKENNHDDMEVDYGENEGSSSEEEESESSSVSEEGDSSGEAGKGLLGGHMLERICLAWG